MTNEPAATPVLGVAKRQTYQWRMEKGLPCNFRRLGKLLASVSPQFYRACQGGLILVLPGNEVRHIATAKELAPLLIDTIRIKVTKEGKLHGELPGTTILNHMLRSERFLAAFRPVVEVTTTPICLPDFAVTQPGYNAGGVLYLGNPPAAADGLEAINRFLDVMGWAGNADRTNAVAAGLTVPFRHHFPGGKPLVLVTATKSHAGKGTVIDFIRGGVPKVDILYESVDWPMEKSLQQQLSRHPETGVVNLDNVRIDSAGGRAKVIRTGFLESFITNTQISLNSPGLPGFRSKNKFVVVINTNEGTLSPDLLNRALPIHLAPKGDVTELLARSPIGNPKLDYLPRHRDQIDAELWGMIERWRKAGMPLEESVAWHPMSTWAKTIGGILKVNGFKDFLANYSTTKWAADPIREALAILASAAQGKPKRASEWAELAVEQGLANTLFKAGERDSLKGRERAMGVLLSPYQGETFERTTETHRYLFKLTKESRRWEGQHPHVRYTFEIVSKEAVEGASQEEDQTAGPGSHNALHEESEPAVASMSDEEQDDLCQYRPEKIPASCEEPKASTSPMEDSSA